MNTAETEFDLGNKCVIQRKFKDAIAHYKKSAQNSYADAQYNLGFCYSHGIGVKQNYLDAIIWYNKAIANGLSQAEDLLNELKTHGDAVAQYNLGSCYAKGYGVTQDYKQAVYWFTLAAEQGDVEAQYNLGCCYDEGKGVDINYKRAACLYTKASQQGHAYAQYCLSKYYEEGKGVAKNYEQAERWYRKATEHGFMEEVLSEKIAEERNQANHNNQYKDDRDDIESYLQINKITCFYHFTALENIESIRQRGGLYSWHFCEKEGIQIPIAGGDDTSRSLDVKYGLQNYVRLSFCDDHPMSYRLMQNGTILVLLRIKTDVALWRSTIFSDINAADRNHKRGSDYNFLSNNINIPATQRHYVSRDDDDFKLHQAEILVEEFIPAQYILNLDNPSTIYK